MKIKKKNFVVLFFDKLYLFNVLFFGILGNVIVVFIQVYWEINCDLLEGCSYNVFEVNINIQKYN